jgi:4-diphosphocytidyl-2-C-methyl-D-erythritol kinase
MTKKSYAKVNIFLKISGKRDGFHELVSRFVRVHSLFDTISFKIANCNEFTLVGNFGCDTNKNTIFKAYQILSKKYSCVKDYFQKHKVIVDKVIPEFAGLGGGSSNCATFIIMVNEVCNLNLSKDKLSKIGAQIGADIPFFIYEYDSANVTGIGEIVKKYDEPILNIEIITPKIKCDTGDIFKEFRDNFYTEIIKEESKELLNMNSLDIVKKLSINEANDLYLPAKKCNNNLQNYAKKDWFFSGSGSSFFKLSKVN